LQGKARKEFVALRGDIVDCLALVEALIDFGEGEEIEEGAFEEGACVAHAYLFLFWDVRLFKHLFMMT
jgi:tRNA U34 5-carboxymethylaminomethyl modifying GTPase MnmE/TrmE